MDKELLKNFYIKYQKEIYLYLYHLCKNKALAEDMLQETFLKALLSLPDKHTNVRAWLYMVARNLYFNYQKREKSSISIDDYEEEVAEENQEILEKLISSENARMLYQALARLDDRKREIIHMQYFAGLSQKEIAAILQITPENVRVLAYRAKKELKSYLKEVGYEIS